MADDTALIAATQISKLNKSQLAFLNKQFKKDREQAHFNTVAGYTKDILTNPVIMLLAGFVLVDYLEQKTWGDTDNTMLGPAAANTIRGALAGGALVGTLGTTNAANAIGEVARAGGAAVSGIAGALGTVATALIPGPPVPP